MNSSGKSVDFDIASLVSGPFMHNYKDCGAYVDSHIKVILP